ncbi:MAG: biotin-dependent carboxyltransferase family protein [Sphingobacteriales bacterium]|nr:biotin-dependent carboxyltransferase family protein [Sphingobacteriales bacterium]
MGLKIIKPGLLSTIQDAGRTAYLDQAVAISGAMDQFSFSLANLLVGNDENEAVIEFTFGGIEILAQSDLLIAFVGAQEFITINEMSVPSHRPVFVPAQSTLKISHQNQGKFSYLAIAGGLDIPLVLESRSTFLTANFGGFKGRALQKGDELTTQESLSETSKNLLKKLKGTQVNFTNWSIPTHQFSAQTQFIRIIKGPELEWFDNLAIADFVSEPYQITDGNRMGVHLSGKLVQRKKSHLQELLSTAVVPGTIQVSGNGALILLMADCQTTGGYPRIGKVIEVDLPKCAQLKTGDQLQFEFISLKEAEKLYLERSKDLQKLKASVQFKSME